MRVKHLIELLQKEVEKDPSVAELRLVAEFDCYGSTRNDEVKNIELNEMHYDEARKTFVWSKSSGTKFIYLDIWPLHTDGSIPKHTYD